MRKMKSCAVEACQKPAPKGRYCGMHQGRMQRRGSLEIGRRPNGMGNINKGGYVDVRREGRRIYEHIWIAEQALGRRLPRGARVHHVNQNRSDNRPENLVICPTEAYHQLLHRRMKQLQVFPA